MRNSDDFKNGVRAKYADRFKDGGIIVLLEPDPAGQAQHVSGPDKRGAIALEPTALILSVIE